MAKFDVTAVVETRENEDYEPDHFDVGIALKEGFGGDVQLRDYDIEAQSYREPVQRRVALGRQILAVAKPGQIGDWAAYIGVVPGKNHDDEEQSVVETGSKLLLKVARVLFPEFDPKKYRD